jgi:hypothetical protein
MTSWSPGSASNCARALARSRLWVCSPARQQQHYESYLVLLHLAVMHACGSLFSEVCDPAIHGAFLLMTVGGYPDFNPLQGEGIDRS